MYQTAETDRGERRGETTSSQKQEYSQQQTQQGSSSKDEQFERTKQKYQQRTRTARQNARPGAPQLGVIVGGFPSSLTTELTQRCVKKGLFVSNIGVGCGGFSAKDHEVSGVSRMEIIDCNSPNAADHLERARDALEKEGSEVVVVLDVGQDCRSIDLYNKLKLPFVHSGSSEWSDEVKMYDDITAAENHAVVSPFISYEAGLVQLDFEHFARSNPGLFCGWKLDIGGGFADGNTVGAVKRRTLNALSFLVDTDPHGLHNYAKGETGPLGYPGLRAQQQQQGQKYGQQQQGQYSTVQQPQQQQGQQYTTTQREQQQQGSSYEQQQPQQQGQQGQQQPQQQGQQGQQYSTQQYSTQEERSKSQQQPHEPQQSSSSTSSSSTGGLLSKLGFGHKETKEQQQQQPHEQQQGQQGQQGQQSSSSSGGLMSKIGLSSGGTGSSTGTSSSKSSFSVSSPDGKTSFSLSQEINALADVDAVLDMADFLSRKIAKGRKPRVWGLKDWVPGMNALYLETAEYVQEKGFVREQQVQQEGTLKQQEYRAPREPTGHSVQHQREGNITDTTQNYPGTSGENTLGERGQQQRLYERQGQEQYEQQGQRGHPAGSGVVQPVPAAEVASSSQTTQQQREYEQQQGGQHQQQQHQKPSGLSAIASAFGIGSSSSTTSSSEPQQQQREKHSSTSSKEQQQSSTSMGGTSSKEQQQSSTSMGGTSSSNQ
jgi:hypothetical protein